MIKVIVFYIYTSYLYYAFYPIILQGKLYNSEYLKLRVKTEEANLKHSEEIDKLKLKSAPLNSIIDQKQDSLNKIQIQYNRLKSSSDKEIERLKAELEKQKQNYISSKRSAQK